MISTYQVRTCDNRALQQQKGKCSSVNEPFSHALLLLFQRTPRCERVSCTATCHDGVDGIVVAQEVTDVESPSVSPAVTDARTGVVLSSKQQATSCFRCVVMIAKIVTVLSHVSALVSPT